MAATHTPVLVKEILQLFKPQPGDWLLDATVGHGGHARAYLEASKTTGGVVGLDADPHALHIAEQNLSAYPKKAVLIAENMYSLTEALSQMREHVQAKGMIVPEKFNHILLDLGVGSHQLADSTRAFSFRSSGPLKMAYGRRVKLPLARLPELNRIANLIGRYPDALEIIRVASRSELANIIRTYGEERYAEKIAAAIKRKPLITTAAELAHRIQDAVPASRSPIHPATRTFQALRLAVNRELEVLEAALPNLVSNLKPAGIIAVISFHSLEDRIVKWFFRKSVGANQVPLTILTKKPISPSEEEVGLNPRARSAKLRAAQVSLGASLAPQERAAQKPGDSL